ncbi:hypothetical protein BKA66DRAFT_573824 [Pyrenochaeta sp. MPI-SDFR-AT-0127]|nr:hypothetical protein BKA66DRAFT_573824 [Pyrenochaeta sp. MPI-SDFR-AT-0127]
MASDKMHDSKDKNSPAYQKRREQVRKAQRTHRERKENYIKALEDEVHQLRAQERRILEENEALATEVADLKCRIGQTESSVWTLHEDDSWLNADFSLVDVDAYSFEGCGSLPGLQLASIESSECSRSTADSESLSLPDTSAFSSVTATTTISRRTSSWSLGEVNKTDLAMEFILTLEKPCFNRASSAVFDTAHPTNFAVTVPNAMQYHSFLEDDLLTSASKSPHVETSTSLDKLLALSSAFCLASDLTPIQAWQQIVSHPKFVMLDMGTLRRLVEDMLEHIRCYGFGAVIETTVFKMLFSNMLMKN